MSSVKRIGIEMKKIAKVSNEGITGGPIDVSNIYEWQASITGPENTPYAGGTFKLSVSFPTTYPFKPPTVKFITPVYHPNINTNGDICFAMLKDDWAPALNINHILKGLQELLKNPNAASPQRADVAEEYTENKELFTKKAIAETKKHAIA